MGETGGGTWRVHDSDGGISLGLKTWDHPCLPTGHRQNMDILQTFESSQALQTALGPSTPRDWSLNIGIIQTVESESDPHLSLIRSHHESPSLVCPDDEKRAVAATGWAAGGPKPRATVGGPKLVQSCGRGVKDVSLRSSLVLWTCASGRMDVSRLNWMDVFEDHSVASV